MPSYDELYYNLGITDYLEQSVCEQGEYIEQYGHTLSIKQQYHLQYSRLRGKAKANALINNLQFTCINDINEQCSVLAQTNALHSFYSRSNTDYYALPLSERNEKYHSIVQYLQGLSRTKQLYYLSRINQTILEV